jgi:hypothetical protein
VVAVVGMGIGRIVGVAIILRLKKKSYLCTINRWFIFALK